MTQKWEYLEARFPVNHLAVELKGYGSRGWELVQLLYTTPNEYTNVTAVFKRPLVAPAGVAQGVER